MKRILFIYLLISTQIHFAMSKIDREKIAKNIGEHCMLKQTSNVSKRKPAYWRSLERQVVEGECKNTFCINKLFGTLIQIDCDGKRFTVDTRNNQILQVYTLAQEDVSGR